MTDFARLVLASDTTGLRDARAELNHLTRTGARAEGRVERSMRGMSNSYRMAAAAAAGLVAAAAGIGAALRGSQEVQQITNGLRAMGMSTAEAEKALEDIADIADRTRAPLGATAELYRRVSVAGRDLGATQEDVKRFTENVGFALGAAGVGAQEASGALLQLSQAMAGGVVRAEEFNSILEGAFPIAQAAADGIDGAAGSVGRLRAMVVAGEVSSREFFEAIIGQSEALREAFENTETTIGQATTGLSRAFKLLANETDNAFGISSGIATGIDFLADNLELVRAGVLSTAAVIAGMYLPAIVSATGATAAWVASLITLRGLLMTTALGVLIVLLGSAIDFMLRLRSATGSWGEALSALGDLASGVWEGIKTSAQSITPALNAIWRDVESGFFDMLSTLMERWSSFLSGLGADIADVPGLGGISDRLGIAAGGAAGAMARFDAKARAAERAAADLRAEASDLATRGFDKASKALDELTKIVKSETDATSEATKEAEKLKKAIEEMSKAGGGAVEGLSEADKALQDFERSSDRAADSFARMTRSVLFEGAKIGDMLRRLGGNLFESGLSGLLKGSGIGDIFAGFFDQGGMIPAGQFGIAGERGPELVRGPAQVTSRADTARMLEGNARLGGNATLELIAPEGFSVRQRGEIQGIAVKVTSEGLSAYDRSTLPQSVQRISNDPRRRN